MSTLQREAPKPQGKTGYDIRTDILMMAKDIALKEYETQFRSYEIHLLHNLEPIDKPEFPSMDKILDIANQMNDFVGKK